MKELHEIRRKKGKEERKEGIKVTGKGWVPIIGGKGILVFLCI